MNFSVLNPYMPLFWSGLLTTVEVTGAALVLAFALGAVIALLKVLPIRWLRALLDFYTSIFRGIPLIVLLFIAYFATPQLTGYKITMFAASVLTLEAKTELQQRVFYELGYHVGRWIYLMDAADDLEKDIKHNSFNPFKSYTGDDLQGYQTRLLNQSLARAYDAYNLIEIVDFKGILDNMLLYGFPSKQNTVVYRPQEVKDEKSV